MVSSRFRIPDLSEQQVLDNVQLRLLVPGDTLERERFRELMEQHHYLKSDTLVGEQGFTHGQPSISAKESVYEKFCRKVNARTGRPR